jgi:hypothetical protein
MIAPLSNQIPDLYYSFLVVVFMGLEDEMSGACSMHWRDEKCTQYFG